MTILKRFMLGTSAAVVTGIITASDAYAQGSSGGNNFNQIARNINTSIDQLPGLLSAICYLMGLVFAVFGVLKIKDHVEKPSNVPLKEGAIALVAGGSLFALPAILEAMQNTIGTGTAVDAATLNKAKFNVQ
ncbi:MAG: hypothetical protein V4621_01820 [Pseudomonadota bacterium]